MSIVKQICLILITLILCVPFLYLLGNESTNLPQLPLYALYRKQTFIKNYQKVIEKAIQKDRGINIWANNSEDYGQEQANIEEVGRFFAWELQEKGYRVVEQTIDLTEIERQFNKSLEAPKKKSKGKKANQGERDVEKERLKELEENSYAFQEFSITCKIKNKLNQIISKISAKFEESEQNTKKSQSKTKKAEPKSKKQSEQKSNGLNQHISYKRLWFVTIKSSSSNTFQSARLEKQLKKVIKQFSDSKFIILSKYPLDLSLFTSKELNVSKGQLFILKNGLMNNIKKSVGLNKKKQIYEVIRINEIGLLQIDRWLKDAAHWKSKIALFKDKNLKKIEKEYERTDLINILSQVCKQGTSSISGKQTNSIQSLFQIGLDIDLPQITWRDNSYRTAYEISQMVECKKTQINEVSIEWFKEGPPKIIANQTSDPSLQTEEQIEEETQNQQEEKPRTDEDPNNELPPVPQSQIRPGLERTEQQFITEIGQNNEKIIQNNEQIEQSIPEHIQEAQIQLNSNQLKKQENQPEPKQELQKNEQQPLPSHEETNTQNAQFILQNTQTEQKEIEQKQIEHKEEEPQTI